MAGITLCPFFRDDCYQPVLSSSSFEHSSLQRVSFPVAFASLIAVYAAIFSLFVEEIFRGIDPAFLVVGFCLPIFSLWLGVGFGGIRSEPVVAHPAIRSERRVMRAAVWLVPVFFVGACCHCCYLALSGTVAQYGHGVPCSHVHYWIDRARPSARDVAIFLVDAGLLFEEFSSRVSRLVIPAFAFVTFYSLIVILFASAYRLISVYTPERAFLCWGAPACLELFGVDLFLDRHHQHGRLRGHYLRTAALARVLASLEVFCGIMLLLFGVSELLEYAREHRQGRSNK